MDVAQGDLVGAVDFGNTKLAFALATETGAIHEKEIIPTEPSKGVGQAFDKLVAGIQRLIGLGGDSLKAIGIAFGGLVDESGTVALLSPNFPGWKDVRLVAELGAVFPALRFVMDNDANAAALGEYRYGKGQGASSMVYLTVSTGVGGAVVLDGQLLHGVANGAGEFGHMIVSPQGPRCNCGGFGCLEAIASGPSIARRAAALLHSGQYQSSLLESYQPALNEAERTSDGIDAKAVCQAAWQKDPLAMDVMDDVALYLGVAIANIASSIAPEAIVMGGGVMNSAELFLPKACRFAERHLAYRGAKLPRVLVSANADEVALWGAAALAWGSIDKK